MILNRRNCMAVGLALGLGLSAQVAQAVSPPGPRPVHPKHSVAPAPVNPHSEPMDELNRNTWQLQRVQAGPRRAGQITLPKQQAQRPVLRFTSEGRRHEGRLSVTGLCNTLGGGYETDGQRMRTGHFMSTQMACADNKRMRLEREVGQQLEKISVYQIRDSRRAPHTPELELQFSDGSRWYLSGTATREALYGQAEQLFLEVAPDTVRCSHPPMRNASCLRVRELAYDEAGRKRHVSDWQSYYGGIEGFTHEPGFRKVLRIKRYTNPNPPADASRTIDVLDLVVETERVR